jgi:integrase
MIKAYMKEGKKFYEVYVAERDRDKKILARRKRGIASEREAKEVEFQFKSELRDIKGQVPQWTWFKWKNEVLRRVKMKFKNATLQNYEAYLKNWTPPEWDSKKINEISSEEVYNAVESSSSKLSPVSKQTFLKILKRIFQEAVEDGLISLNPARGLNMKAPDSVKKVLTTNEVETLLNAARDVDHRFYPVWCFAVKTGLRSGEMHALLWSDIDFERGLISVTKQWTRKDGVTPTKSRENRVVPISEDLRGFLLDLKKNCEGQDHVLPRLVEWTHGDQAKVIREFCIGAGITPIKFHDLRATFITNMLSQGVPLVKVMSIVGHKNMETTDLYLRLAGVDIKGATDALSYRVPTETSDENVISVNFGQKRS